jgi:hypothetical protein
MLPGTDYTQDRFTISVDREPESVVLDPDLWVLMDDDFKRRN